MKIAVISSQVFALGPGGLSGYGGLEHIAWQQARGLAAKGHEVVLVAPDGSQCPGCSVYPTGPASHFPEGMAYSKMPELKSGETVVRKEQQGYWNILPQMDCICDHSWEKHSYLLKIEGVLKAPILGWLHAPVRTMYNSLPPNVEKPCFVCISHDQAKVFEALHEHEARVCHNGIDLDHYTLIGVPRTNRWLFLARFSAIKGADLALEVSEKADIPLDLIGDTNITNEPDYFNQCKLRCDGVKRKMIGHANRGECVYYLNQAHGFLHLNARFREPLGLAPLEAQAAGTPVIAWDKGAMRETVNHGQTGWLVNSVDETIMRVKEFNSLSLEEQRKIRKNCREWVQNFTVQKMVDRVDELCKEAVDTGGW